MMSLKFSRGRPDVVMIIGRLLFQHMLVDARTVHVSVIYYGTYIPRYVVAGYTSHLVLAGGCLHSEEATVPIPHP